MKRLLLSGLTLFLVTSMLAATAFADTPSDIAKKPLVIANTTYYSGGVYLMGHGFAFKITDDGIVIVRVDFGGGEGI